MALNPDPAAVGNQHVGPQPVPVAGEPQMRQLDFYQAMGDFKSMFPTLDEEVIEAVLRANDGAVDATIDQLLTMTLDSPKEVMLEQREDEADMAQPDEQLYMNQAELLSAAAAAADVSSSDDEVGPDNPPPYHAVHSSSPPSYNDYANLSPTGNMKLLNTVKTSDSADALLALGGPEVDLVFHSTEAGAMASISQFAMDTTPKHQPSDISLLSLDSAENTPVKQPISFPPDEDVVVAPQMPPQMNLLEHSYTIGKQSPLSPPPTALTGSRYRRWDPPMLGTLPDEFLRIQLTPEQLRQQELEHQFNHQQQQQQQPQHVPHHHHHHHPHLHQCEQHTATHHNTSPLQGHHPRKSTASCDNANWSPRTLRASMKGEKRKHKRERPDKQRSLSLTAAHGSDEINSVLIKEKMRENERKRSLASADLNPAQFQMLEDEHLALMLQNKEFLAILKQDQDFMKMLERDRMNATAFEPESPVLDHNRPPSDQIEGYGADHSDELVGAFPFASNAPKDDNAEFRRQLKHMGGTSKKKMQALAKKFFTRKKKKSSKQLLKESAAPSTANLLEEDYSNDELNPHPRELDDDDDAMFDADDPMQVPNHRIHLHNPAETNTSRYNRQFNVI